MLVKVWGWDGGPGQRCGLVRPHLRGRRGPFAVLAVQQPTGDVMCPEEEVRWYVGPGFRFQPCLKLLPGRLELFGFGWKGPFRSGLGFFVCGGNRSVEDAFDHQFTAAASFALPALESGWKGVDPWFLICLVSGLLRWGNGPRRPSDLTEKKGPTEWGRCRSISVGVCRILSNLAESVVSCGLGRGVICVRPPREDLSLRENGSQAVFPSRGVPATSVAADDG